MSKLREDAGGAPGRRGDRRFVSGAARFTGDLPLPAPLHVAVVRSEHAHARIEDIELKGVRGADGIVGVYTWDDIRHTCGAVTTPGSGLEQCLLPPCPPLADGEVCYVGQPVAAIVADDCRVARDALERIHVRYTMLPAALALDDAALALDDAAFPDAARAHSRQTDNVAFQYENHYGDVDETFARAERVVHQRFVLPRDIPYPLEPRSAVACFSPGEEELILWTPTHVPDLLRSRLALALGIPESSLRVAVPDVGGDFGLRLHAHPEEALVCALARILAPRPVKWIEERRESVVAAPQGNGQVADLAVATRRDGKLLGIRLETLVDVGAFQLLLAPDPPSSARDLLAGVYDFPVASVRLTGLLTNAPPTDALGPGWQGQVTYMVERMLDITSRALELDPVEVRRINLRKGRPPADGGCVFPDFPEPEGVLEALLEMSEMQSLREARKARRARGELSGIGLALSSQPVGGGAGRVWKESGWESARVRVGTSEDVEVFTGACSHGPGLEIAYAAIAAEVLGVRPEAVRVHRGDTACCPRGTGSAGGRALPVGGCAVLEAARRVKRQMRTVAAHVLGVAEDYVEQAGSTFLAGEKSVSLEDVCREAYEPGALPADIAPGLEATCYHRASSPTRTAGAHVCTVSVDPETGQVRVEQYHAVGDFGKVIHAPAVRGEIHGGVARAVGRALLEPPVCDDDELGMHSPHAVPVMDQLPDLNWGRTETPSPVNALGARGVGDAGAASALPAVVNAVMDALNSPAVVHLDFPLTPERIWRCLTASSEETEDGSA